MECLKTLNDISGILTAICAIIALVFVIYQVNSARKDSRRATAYAAYDAYLKLCVENAEFAVGDETYANHDTDRLLRYKWFVANMLFAFEQVLEACKDDNTWEETIRNQLNRHAWHLHSSKSAERNEWSQQLKNLFPTKKTKQ